MFKFETSAATIQELRHKILDAYRDLISHEVELERSAGSRVDSTGLVPTPTQPLAVDAPAAKESIDAVPAFEPTKFEQNFPTIVAPQQAEPTPVRFPIQPERPTAATSDSQLDQRGVPWMEHVHASSKALNEDGSWRKRRGIDDAQLKAAEAPHLAQFKTPAAIVTQALGPAPVAQPAVMNDFIRPAVKVDTPVFASPQQPAQVAIAQSVNQTTEPVQAQTYENIAVPPTTRPAHSLETFKLNLVPVIAKLVAEGMLTQEYINQLNTYFGVKHVFQINETQKQELFETLVENGRITRVG